NRPVDSVQRRGRLLHRDARLQTAEQVYPVATAILEITEAGIHQATHRDRNKDGRFRAKRRALESTWRDTHDRHALTIDQNRLAHDGSIGAEMRLPIPVTQDRDVVRADRLVVRRTEQAAERRPQSQ